MIGSTKILQVVEGRELQLYRNIFLTKMYPAGIQKCILSNASQVYHKRICKRNLRLSGDQPFLSRLEKILLVLKSFEKKLYC